MTCITINDLPSVETILPGELEQIFGAGPRTFRPSFEQLEDRQLLAASVTASFQNGVLDVEGTSGSDAIYLAQDNGNIQGGIDNTFAWEISSCEHVSKWDGDGQREQRTGRAGNEAQFDRVLNFAAAQRAVNV